MGSQNHWEYWEEDVCFQFRVWFWHKKNFVASCFSYNVWKLDVLSQIFLFRNAAKTLGGLGRLGGLGGEPQSALSPYCRITVVV